MASESTVLIAMNMIAIAHAMRAILRKVEFILHGIA